MLAVVEHENAIAHSLQITNAVASDRLTSASASSNIMSAAWKIGDSGRRCGFWEMQGFSR
jgi:hypothetical protein